MQSTLHAKIYKKHLLISYTANNNCLFEQEQYEKSLKSKAPNSRFETLLCASETITAGRKFCANKNANEIEVLHEVCVPLRGYYTFASHQPWARLMYAG